jgi:hypothetical protein
MRKLNVVLAPGSAAHRAVEPPAPEAPEEAPEAPEGAAEEAPEPPEGAPEAPEGAPEPREEAPEEPPERAPEAPGGAPAPNHLAAGFEPRPAWNLKNIGGRTIADLVFVNRYVGEAGAWAEADMENIDRALAAALSDAGLQSVIAQYFPGPITSRMLPSATHQVALPATVYKDTVEQLAVKLHGEGVLGEADPTNSVINIMLPKGIMLSDEVSPGFQAPAGTEEAWEHRRAGTIKLDSGDAADSGHGLGGYHGSIHVAGGVETYYAVGVYSEGANGIDAFPGQPWKNVVATFYHELNEARTDADVEDVNATNDEKLLGWYSQTGQGEIGDLPINACGGNLELVFKEVALADGTMVPIQLMWSNLASGPAA